MLSIGWTVARMAGDLVTEVIATELFEREARAIAKIHNAEILCPGSLLPLPEGGQAGVSCLGDIIYIDMRGVGRPASAYELARRIYRVADFTGCRNVLFVSKSDYLPTDVILDQRKALAKLGFNESFRFGGVEHGNAYPQVHSWTKMVQTCGLGHAYLADDVTEAREWLLNPTLKQRAQQRSGLARRKSLSS